MALPVAGHAVQEDRLRGRPSVRVPIDHRLKMVPRLSIPVPVEGNFPQAQFQVGEKIVIGDIPHHPVVLLPSGVEHEQCGGPLDGEPFHEVGPLVPKTFAFYRDELLFDVLLHLFARIRTRIHGDAAQSPLEPEIEIDRFFRFLRPRQSSAELPFPLDLGHVSSPFPRG